MAECQGNGAVCSGMLHDGETVILLLREHLRTRVIGRSGARRDLVRENLRGSSHEGLGQARYECLWAGCVRACTLRGYVPRCSLGHRERRTAERGSDE